MNTKNNKRRRDSVEKIEKAFIEFLQTKELKDITVSDICKKTKLNRSTFYANFLDIYDLAEKVCIRLEKDFSEEFKESSAINGAEKMFNNIMCNQLFYKTYFKLGGYQKPYEDSMIDGLRAEKDFGGKYLDYHIEFFKSGLNAIIQMWLKGGCKESPAEMAEILKTEYRGR